MHGFEKEGEGDIFDLGGEVQFDTEIVAVAVVRHFFAFGECVFEDLVDALSGAFHHARLGEHVGQEAVAGGAADAEQIS